LPALARPPGLTSPARTGIHDAQVRRLPLALAAALALVFLAFSATAARGACLDVAVAAAGETDAAAHGPDEGDCSDCEEGCAECLCCQAPLAVGASPRPAALVPARAHVPPRPAVLAGELHAPAPFQPPRA
jgi:hypothetical protein